MKKPLTLVLLFGLITLVVAHFHSRSAKDDESGRVQANSHDAQPAVSERDVVSHDGEDWGDVPQTRPQRRVDGSVDPDGKAWVSPAELVELEKKAKEHVEKHRLKVDPEFAKLSLDEKIDALPPEYRQRAIGYRDRLRTTENGLNPYICWSPGTSAEVLNTFTGIESEAGLAAGEARTLARQFLDLPHWDTTATNGPGNNVQGLPVTLTWSIIPDGTLGAENTGFEPFAPSDFRAWMASLYGSVPSSRAEDQPWFPIFQAAFDSLEAQTGINFVYQPEDDGEPISAENVGNSNRGDIRIGAYELDGSFGVLGFAFPPDFGDITFDSSDGFYDNIDDDSLGLFNVLTHEIGHAIGLAHVCPIEETKLMEPFVSKAFRGPQFDDIYSLNRQYGDPWEVVEPNFRNNDTPAQAATLEPERDTIDTFNDMSLDDPTDVDYYKVTLFEDEGMNVRVVPSNPLPIDIFYFEGEQFPNGLCSAGTPFNPTNIIDLEISIIDTDGNTILANSNSQAAAENEDLFGFTAPVTGNYFIRVEGAGDPNAQLYHMETFVSSSENTADVEFVQADIADESNRPRNMSADPNETVVLDITVINDAAQPTDDVQLVPRAVAGLTDFTDYSQSLDLAPDETGVWSFTFAQDADCSDVIEYTFDVESEGSFIGIMKVTVEFSDVIQGSSIDEPFDVTEKIPANWPRQTIGAGTPWGFSNVRPDPEGDTVIGSAFAGSVPDVGWSILSTPELELGPQGGTFAFRHWYSLEDGFDGAVLEISVAGGPWEDLILHPNVTVTGEGYDQAISGQFNSPISGRQAWTGFSETYQSISVNFNETWAGQMIQIRWALTSDSNNVPDGVPGWFVDTVMFDSEGFGCVPFRPALSVDADSAQLARGVSVPATLSTPLPLNQDVTMTFDVSGDITLADLDSSVEVTIPAGQTEVDFPVELRADFPANIEVQTLVLSIPQGGANFEAEAPDSKTFVLGATTSGALTFATWSEDFPGLSTDPLVDDDGDGFSNLLEYAFGTDPLVGTSTPQTTTVLTATQLEIQLPTLPSNRPDIVVGAETSTDLVNWTDTGVVETADGFAVDRTGPLRFLRLTVELLSP